MKQLSLLVLLSFLFSSSNGQAPSLTSAKAVIVLKEQAIKLADALKNRDCDAYMVYQHPNAIRLLGGRQSAVEKIKQGWNKAEEDSIRFLSITVGEPSKMISVKEELQTTMPQTMEMKVKATRVIIKTTLVCISLDGGNHWYFVDAFRKNFQIMKSVLPTLSEEIVIPPDTPPQVLKN